ncbi:MAG: histidine phosphatase family protein [Clostridia bacterium]|nr:histidine phosphatase family protein [Clostridia bacterium]MBR4442584.1 histidine phosphatase family protein [Clostridia bacterium]
MEVYLIRHGESEANAGGYHSGWAPVSLTEKGRSQARETAALIENVPFDRIVASDLKRAQQTAQIIFPNRAIEYNADIRELDTSHLFGRLVSDLKKEMGETYLNARRTFDYGPLGCESQAAFLVRVRRFFDGMASMDCERAAVVAHAGVIRALGSFALNLPILQFNVPVYNCSVSVLELMDGAWRLQRWNCGKLG